MDMQKIMMKILFLFHNCKPMVLLSKRMLKSFKLNKTIGLNANKWYSMYTVANFRV